MRSKKHTYIFVISVIIFLTAGAIFLLTQKKERKPVIRDLSEIEKLDTLRVVTNFDQIGYYVSADTIAGFNYELLKALEKSLNINLKVSVENSLDKSFEELKYGKYDLIARNIPVNTSIRSEYKFTEPIIHNKLVLVQKSAEYNLGVEPVRSHLQLAKKTIHIPKDAPSKLRLINLAHEIGDTINIVENDTYEAEQLAMMVASDDIYYTICDEKTAETLAAKFPELDVKTDIGFTHLESWAVRATSPVLLDSLNIWINRFKQTKEYQAIYKKYYH